MKKGLLFVAGEYLSVRTRAMKLPAPYLNAGRIVRRLPVPGQ